MVNHSKVTDQNGVVSSKPLSDAEKIQITDLVKEAMGFSNERGDTLNVVNSPLRTSSRKSCPSCRSWQQPEMIELAQQIAKTLLIGALILYLVLGVLRPMLKRTNQPPPPLLTDATEQQGG